MFGDLWPPATSTGGRASTGIRPRSWVVVAVIASAGCFDSTQPVFDGFDPDVQLIGETPGVARAISESGFVAGSAGGGIFRIRGSDTLIVEPPEGARMTLRGLNERGWMVGGIQRDDIPQAFLWLDDGLHVLNTGGAIGARAEAINESGLVVGWVLITPDRAIAAVWDDFVFTPIGPPEATSGAFYVNDAGDVAGRFQAIGSRGAGSFHWRGGTYTELPTLGSSLAIATDLNEAGQIVGYSARPASDDGCGGAPAGPCRAVLWQDGELVTLGSLERESRAAAINDAGHVAGSFEPERDRRRAFLWIDGDIQDLGSLGEQISPWDMNDAGDIVGVTIFRGTPHAFLWRGGQLGLLATLGAPGSQAWAVSEAGVVVGRTGREGFDDWFPVVWDPN